VNSHPESQANKQPSQKHNNYCKVGPISFPNYFYQKNENDTIQGTKFISHKYWFDIDWFHFQSQLRYFCLKREIGDLKKTIKIVQLVLGLSGFLFAAEMSLGLLEIRLVWLGSLLWKTIVIKKSERKLQIKIRYQSYKRQLVFLVISLFQFKMFNLNWRTYEEEITFIG
jgi:hypothetical protein